jgi:hypothetical protein
MILYKAIKYKIFEMCLDTLLNGISKNFIKNGKYLRVSELQTEMELKELVLRGPGTTFYDCIVSYAKCLGKSSTGESVYYIDLRYKKSTNESLDSRLLRNKEGYIILDLKTYDADCEIILK